MRVQRPSREQVARYFAETDADESGELDRGEFKNMMLLLFEQCALRVLTIVVIMVCSPVIAHAIVVKAQAFQATALYEGTVAAAFGHRKNLDCVHAATTTAFPFVNEQLFTTIISVAMVTTLVPWLYARYDAMLLGKKMALKEAAAAKKEGHHHVTLNEKDAREIEEMHRKLDDAGKAEHILDHMHHAMAKEGLGNQESLELIQEICRGEAASPSKGGDSPVKFVHLAIDRARAASKSSSSSSSSSSSRKLLLVVVIR